MNKLVDSPQQHHPREERRHSPPLSDSDIQKIANAVAAKAKESFHIEDEEHYNSHKRLDKLLDIYDRANSALVKTLIALVILGILFFAGAGFLGAKITGVKLP